MKNRMRVFALSGTLALGLVLLTGELGVARQNIQPPGQILLAVGPVGVSGGMVIRVSHNFASLSWQPVNDPRVDGYKVYKGTDPKNLGGGKKVGLVTSYTFDGLGQGKTWYFAVSSYGKDGKKNVESVLTNITSKYIEKVKGDH